ncbi:acyl carrier protein [Streptomyces sp. NPDC058220]|uniref:acyl carrier protein n=1 Tax=unclassified Streptomyces TaxID=2593676 RepID=UPI0036475078
MTVPADTEIRVKKVLSEILGGKFAPHEISADADMVGELGLDSLQAIQFLLRIEDEFDIELDYETLSLEHLRSVRQFSAQVIGGQDERP